MSAGTALRERASVPAGPPQAARVPALEVFLWSRLALWLAALLAVLWFEPRRHPDWRRWDHPSLHDLGWALDVWARWDSAWFLRIAEHGYATDPELAPAFFPLYPGLVGLGGRLLGGHYVLAGVLVSLAAAAGAFVLLARLAEAHLGDEGARRAVLYLALFPTSLFLGAVYSESLFLLLALAAFVLAERGRWPAAAAAAALAILTRPVGLALLAGLAVVAWRSDHRRRSLAWLAASPLALVLFPALLARQVDDPWAWLHAQDAWHRELSPLGPLAGIWHGARAAWAGLRQAVAGADGRVHWPIADADPLHAAAVNISSFAFLVLFAVLTVVAWRRFGAPYGVFAAAGLAIPLSAPSERWPLLSLPRFGLVLFPLVLALAVVGARPRLHVAIAGGSAILLGVAVVQWALWQWVA